MTDTTEIRRRPDGSIDIEHYAAIGQDLRSASLHDALSRLAVLPRRLTNRLPGWVRRRGPGSPGTTRMPVGLRTDPVPGPSAAARVEQPPCTTPARWSPSGRFHGGAQARGRGPGAVLRGVDET